MGWVMNMEATLLERLSGITPEERRILAGETGVDRSLYTAGQDPVFRQQRLMRGEDPIEMRTHTRFVEFPLHGHNFVEMMVVVSGSITHALQGRRVQLQTGDLLLMNRHMLHAISPAGEGDIGVNFIMPDAFFEGLWPELSDTIFADFLEENRHPRGQGQFLHLRARGHKPIENLIENLIFELIRPQKDRPILQRTMALLFAYLSQDPGLLVDATARVSKTDAQKRRVLQYLQANYPRATLAELAERLGLSAPYLSKWIRDHFQRTFQSLLLETRLERARELLEGTSLPVTDIIRRVGYENGSYFHRKFLEKYGVTPHRYRKG